MSALWELGALVSNTPEGNGLDETQPSPIEVSRCSLAVATRSLAQAVSSASRASAEWASRLAEAFWFLLAPVPFSSRGAAGRLRWPPDPGARERPARGPANSAGNPGPFFCVAALTLAGDLRALAGCEAEPITARPSASPSDPAAYAAQIVRVTNDERTANHLPMLSNSWLPPQQAKDLIGKGQLTPARSTA